MDSQVPATVYPSSIGFCVGGKKAPPPPPPPPPWKEIVCIETTKVYDFCFQVEHRDNVCFNLPKNCIPSLGAYVACTITSVTCTEVPPRIPLTTPGFFNVTLLLTVNADIQVLNPAPTPICDFPVTFSFTKTVTLCAPDGTTVVCDVPSYSCGPCVLTPADQVCCQFNLCLLVETDATVKLLLPAYGFCVPAECAQVSPEFPECPPTDLFPPQCTLPTGAR